MSIPTALLAVCEPFISSNPRFPNLQHLLLEPDGNGGTRAVATDGMSLIVAETTDTGQAATMYLPRDYVRDVLRVAGRRTLVLPLPKRDGDTIRWEVGQGADLSVTPTMPNFPVWCTVLRPRRDEGSTLGSITPDQWGRLNSAMKKAKAKAIRLYTRESEKDTIPWEISGIAHVTAYGATMPCLY